MSSNHEADGLLRRLREGCRKGYYVSDARYWQSERRKEWQAFSRRLTGTARSREEYSYLISRELDELYSALTHIQLEVVELYLYGATFEEIGRLRGCSKQGVQHTFRLAAKKLVAKRKTCPWTGLAQAWRELTTPR